MSESSSERFRRIIGVWRREKRAKAQKQVDPSARSSVGSDRAAEPASTSAPPGHRPRSAPDGRRHNNASRPTSNLQWPGKARRAAAADAHSEPVPSLAPAPDPRELQTPSDAQRFLDKLRAKTVKVVQDFANGTLNQRQFHAIYAHYQRQRREIEAALIQMPGSGAWRAAAVEGHTTVLRKQHAAQVLSYAIYQTESGIPLSQTGDLSVDPGLLVPMLSSFRSITQELFGAGMRRTEIEGGRWLYFVPGRYTTLIVVFSAEPATLQLRTIEDLHRDFEFVNKLALAGQDVGQRALTFTHLWAFEQESSAA